MSDTFLIAVEQCPLCESTRKNLFCAGCVWKGNFTHSSDNGGGETYSEKGKRIVDLSDVIKPYFANVKSVEKKVETLSRKQVEVAESIFRIQTLKEVIHTLEKEALLRQADLSRRKEDYERRKDDLEAYRVKVDESLREMQSYKHETQALKDRYKDAKSELVRRRQKSIRCLKDEVFPITTRPVYKEFGTPPGETIATRGLSTDLVVETSCSPEMDLEEATTCTYTEGRWVQTSLSENEYCIIGCGLPASSDYYKYFEWLKSHRKETRGPESESNVHSHPALEIPAALMYACQALKISSKILGVNLPYNISYGDFANPYIQQRKLLEAILKLNKNTMYLSFSQLIDTSFLSPLQTLQNLDICLSEKNQLLGHIGNFHTQEYRVPNVLDLDAPDDGDYDCDDEDDPSAKEDWDSLKDLQDLARDMSFSEGESVSTEQLNSSSATGLVTSAAASMISFWPWKKS